MREKWKALTKRERRLFAAALVFLALAVLLRFVPGLRFSAATLVQQLKAAERGALPSGEMEQLSLFDAVG